MIDLDIVKKVSSKCLVPLTVGGGITNIHQIGELLKAGADKISVNSAAVKRPELINELNAHFGAQFVVVAIDAKKTEDGWKVYLRGGRDKTELDLFDWAKEVEQRGAGEILFTSMGMNDLWPSIVFTSGLELKTSKRICWLGPYISASRIPTLKSCEK